MDIQKGIYTITNNDTGKVYVGSTAEFNQRKKSHIKHLNENKHSNYLLQNDWIKYNGRFTFKFIEYVEDTSMLLDIESKYMHLYKDYKGVYNLVNPMSQIKISHSKLILKRVHKKEMIRDKSTYSYTEKQILTYLNNHFIKFKSLMFKNIKEKYYFDKIRVDEWIIKNIDDDKVLRDSRLSGIIEKFYEDNNFKVISIDGYRCHIESICNINLPEENRDIIIHNNLMHKIRNRKIGIIHKKRNVVL